MSFGIWKVLDHYDIVYLIREAIQKKSGLVMDSSVRGLTPSSLIFGSYGTHEAHLFFGHQKGEKLNFPKTSKMAIFRINFLEKVPKVYITLYFTQQFLNS